MKEIKWSELINYIGRLVVFCEGENKSRPFSVSKVINSQLVEERGANQTFFNEPKGAKIFVLI